MKKKNKTMEQRVDRRDEEGEGRHRDNGQTEKSGKRTGRSLS